MPCRHVRRCGGTTFHQNLTSQAINFYGVDGVKLATYWVRLEFPTWWTEVWTTKETAVYFGGRRVGTNKNGSNQAFVADRLGSATQALYPYGEDKTTSNPKDQIDFATYTRDSATMLDYADQRYYTNQWGRFLTPDPSDPGDTTNPQSFNLYSYVLNDPINLNDPEGLEACGALLGFGMGGRTLSDLILGDDDAGLLGRLVWAEGSRSVFAPWYIQEKTAVAVSVVNRWKIDNGLIFVQDASGNYLPTNFGGTTYKSIIGASKQYASFTKGSDPQLTAGFQKSLNGILNTDIGVGRQAWITDPSNGEMYSVNESCFDVIESYVAGNLGVRGDLTDPFTSKGVTVSFNLGNVNPNPGTMIGFGHVGVGAPTYFFGYANTTTTSPPHIPRTPPPIRRPCPPGHTR